MVEPTDADPGGPDRDYPRVRTRPPTGWSRSPLRDLLTIVQRNARFVVRHPRILPRLARGWTLAGLGRAPLRKVELAVTWACPARCEHCSASELPRGEELSADEVVRVGREAVELGAMNLHLTGGEAALRGDLPDIVARLADQPVVVSLATNGVPFTAAVARDLARAGLRFVSVSLDSAQPAVHDAMRGLPGCWDAALEAVRLARTEGIQPFLCMVVTRRAIHDGDARQVLALARELGVPLTLVLPTDVGRWAGRPELRLGPEELAAYRSMLREPGVRWEGMSNWLRESCPAGREKLYVTPTGDVMPCNFQHRPYGNLRRESLAAIRARVLADPAWQGEHRECRAGCGDHPRCEHRSDDA